MDGLDLLKKNWDNILTEKKFSSNELYAMLKKKSSSIVKTLFYISIAEFMFWIMVNMSPNFYSKAYNDKLNELYSDSNTYTIITVVSYIIILIFIRLLYASYKKIKVTDNAKKLMENILHTRKIIQYYVIYNVIIAGLFLLYGFYDAFSTNTELSSKINSFNSTQMFIAISVIIICTALFVALIWAFYLLIYGLLLKKLNYNYKELQKLEK